MEETTETVDKSVWKIGSIVALRSHLYSGAKESETIIITGEPKVVSPLMVIVEKIPEKNSYDQATGMQLTHKDNFSCKCIWFSHKSFHFEEAWISSRLLKVIRVGTNISKELQYGEFVEFKTIDIELGKRKSTLRKTDNSYKHQVTADLSFVSPVMQVIGTTKNESKEPLHDTKTLKKIREVSRYSVKCKFYNNYSDKMSEVIIPVEALRVIEPASEDILEQVKKSIKTKKYLVVKKKGKAAKILVEPKNINYRSNRFYLNAYQYLDGKNSEIDICKIETIVSYPNWFTHELPNFTIAEGKVQFTPINKTTLEALIHEIGNDRAIWITYKDSKENITHRIIQEYIILPGVDESTGEEYIYLEAFCMLRKAKRYFRLDRIEKLKVLVDFKEDDVIGS